MSVRDMARAFCERVAPPGGVAADDPLALEVTEGRIGTGYSSCGDLPHAMLYALGVRASWLNRDELNGWKPGVNITRFTSPLWGAKNSCPASRRPRPGELLDTGDIAFTWNRDNGTDAHALVVNRMTPERLTSWDYGQPGGAPRTRTLSRRGDMWVAGGKLIQCVVPLLSVVGEAERPGPVVSIGDHGAAVAEIQRALAASADGHFGPMTRQAVRTAQRLWGLVETGSWGDPEREALSDA